MSELVFELAEDRPLQQWQKWANLARLEAIRADKAERERDTLLAALKAAPPHEYVIDTDGISYVNYVDADIYVWWSNSQRQAAIKMVEGEQGETA